MLKNVRQPCVAGLFYPADAQALREQVGGLLEAAAARTAARDNGEAAQSDRSRPKAIIAPHAGYVYSGEIAASAYAPIAGEAAGIRRVVLLGPAHRLPFRGIACADAAFFATPLGHVPVDSAGLDRIADLPGVQRLDAAFNGEHCLEVQLPFLQALLSDFAIVPLLAGSASDAQVAAVLEQLWDGDETLIVISSDLSHYLDYASAKAIDKRTSDAILSLRPEGLGDNQACGRIPIAGLLREARAHGLHASLLDLRNSGDTAGPRDRVVGYGAYAFG